MHFYREDRNARSLLILFVILSFFQACIAVDTNGTNCFLKSICGGVPGHCPSGAECGYRRGGVGPSPPPTPPAPPVPPAPMNVTLREAAEPHHIYVGAATNAIALANATDPTYKRLEQSQFDIVTAENACKFGPLHPERNTYDWSGNYAQLQPIPRAE